MLDVVLWPNYLPSSNQIWIIYYVFSFLPLTQDRYLDICLFIMCCVRLVERETNLIALYLFVSVDFNFNAYILNCRFLKMRFVLHFSSTYIHQNFQLYSYLYSEGFY